MLGLIDGYDNRIFNVGVYVRLSREDLDATESESIKNQKDYLTRYVIENGWNLVEVYCDDGYSGTNFDRPSFQRLIEDIESKRINMVITKDLSRLGRDYIGTGHYLERYFPEHNVRYIAVNDGIDTFNESSNNDMSPFRSVINDMYAKDISKKVRSVMDAKRNNGEFIGAFAPYGYAKDPQDKSKLIIDKEVAPIIVRVFEMYLQGHGYSHICHVFNDEGILSPAAYKAQKTKYKNPKSKLGLWTHETIKRILTNPTYAGNLTQNRSKKINYKVKKLKAISKNNWITVKGTHEPIIPAEKFELVQQMINKKVSNEYSTEKSKHMLSGLIFCGDCGERMTFTKTAKGTSYCICSKYKRFKKCSRHSFLEEGLEKHVLDELKQISKYAIDKEKLLKIAQDKSNNTKGNKLEDDIAQINNRLTEIKRVIKNLYEDKLKGIISELDFIDLTQDYNKEREQLNKRLNNLDVTRKELAQHNSETDRLITLVQDIASFDNISKAIIAKLVDKIEIFEEQKIVIHYKFKKPF
ncbi:recombinase family protein [Alkaliphilus transvaalensis]|uniref:recombinase family protein n=1 Tax=Alkaliphilus transvaalensis TaxID=114628 RepID=UPI000559583F|nr:recombinase family protein [Alkaliphilus transvaalensis]